MMGVASGVMHESNSLTNAPQTSTHPLSISDKTSSQPCISVRCTRPMQNLFPSDKTRRSRANNNNSNNNATIGMTSSLRLEMPMLWHRQELTARLQGHHSLLAELLQRKRKEQLERDVVALVGFMIVSSRM